MELCIAHLLKRHYTGFIFKLLFDSRILSGGAFAKQNFFWYIEIWFNSSEIQCLTTQQAAQAAQTWSALINTWSFINHHQTAHNFISDEALSIAWITAYCRFVNTPTDHQTKYVEKNSEPSN